DKDDYSPGEIAIITGTGWTLDSIVDIHLEEDPAHDHHHGYHGTVVDANGNWRIEYPIEDRHLGVAFTVIVDGVQSKYQGLAYFTDGNVNFGISGNVPNNTEGFTVTVTYTPATPPNSSQVTQTIGPFKSQNTGAVAAKDGTSISWIFNQNGNYVWEGSSTLSQGFIVQGNYTGNNSIKGNYNLCTAPSIIENPENQTMTYGSNASF